MGYVEDIQKVNNLARDLLKNGIATSHDDAIQKATSMLSKSSDCEALVANRRDVKEQKNDLTWQEAMSKNNKFLIEQFQQLTTQISLLSKELSAVRAEMAQLKRPESRPVHTEQPQQQRAPAVVDPSISVEKVFYFGKK